MADISEREEKATTAHIAAKDAYRNDRTPKNRAAKERTAAKLTDIRNEERADRAGTGVAGDAFVVGSN